MTVIETEKCNDFRCWYVFSQRPFESIDCRFCLQGKLQWLRLNSFNDHMLYQWIVYLCIFKHVYFLTYFNQMRNSERSFRDVILIKCLSPSCLKSTTMQQCAMNHSTPYKIHITNVSCAKIVNEFGNRMEQLCCGWFVSSFESKSNSYVCLEV